MSRSSNDDVHVASPSNDENMIDGQASPSAILSFVSQLSLHSEPCQSTSSSTTQPTVSNLPMHMKGQSQHLQQPMDDPSRSASLYVKNLGPDADELFLYRKFAPFGALLSCKIKTDPITNLCRGVGFVNFMDHDAAMRAQNQLHGSLAPDGRPMHISIQQPRAVRAAQAAAAAATGPGFPGGLPGNFGPLAKLTQSLNGLPLNNLNLNAGGNAGNSLQGLLANLQSQQGQQSMGQNNPLGGLNLAQLANSLPNGLPPQLSNLMQNAGGASGGFNLNNMGGGNNAYSGLSSHSGSRSSNGAAAPGAPLNFEALQNLQTALNFLNAGKHNQNNASTVQALAAQQMLFPPAVNGGVDPSNLVNSLGNKVNSVDNLNTVNAGNVSALGNQFNLPSLPMNDMNRLNMNLNASSDSLDNALAAVNKAQSVNLTQESLAAALNGASLPLTTNNTGNNMDTVNVPPPPTSAPSTSASTSRRVSVADGHIGSSQIRPEGHASVSHDGSSPTDPSGKATPAGLPANMSKDMLAAFMQHLQAMKQQGGNTPAPASVPQAPAPAAPPSLPDAATLIQQLKALQGGNAGMPSLPAAPPVIEHAQMAQLRAMLGLAQN